MHKSIRTILAAIILLVLEWPGLAHATCQSVPRTADCFPSYSSELTAALRSRLSQLAAEVKAELESLPASKGLSVAITGFGLRGYSSEASVQAVALERATEAKKFLGGQFKSWGEKTSKRLVFAALKRRVLDDPKNSTVHARALMRKVSIDLNPMAIPPKPTTKNRGLFYSPPTELDAELGLTFPKDMPAPRFPKTKRCSEAEAASVKKAWAIAHHNVWRAHQTLQWLKSHPKLRQRAWSDTAILPADLKTAAARTNTSPRTWFGPYSQKRFNLVENAIRRVFKRRFLGKTFKVVCKAAGPDQGGASHNLYGRVVVYSDFHTYSEGLKALYLIHEICHGLMLKNGTWVMDTHVFCDKKAGGKCSASKHYDEAKSLQLAYGSRPRHYRLAIRNNDNLAYFASNLGLATLGKRLRSESPFPRKKWFPRRGFK